MIIKVTLSDRLKDEFNTLKSQLGFTCAGKFLSFCVSLTQLIVTLILNSNGRLAILDEESGIWKEIKDKRLENLYTIRNELRRSTE